MDKPKILVGDWAAGLFEGEGCGYILRRNGGKEFRLSMAQVDRRALDKFYEDVKLGTVRGPYGPYKTTKQAYYLWDLTGPDAMELAEALIPKLCGKGEQLQKKLNEVRSEE
jgi:hypothetical protein